MSNKHMKSDETGRPLTAMQLAFREAMEKTPEFEPSQLPPMQAKRYRK